MCVVGVADIVLVVVVVVDVEVVAYKVRLS